VLVKGQVRERGTDVELTVDEILPLAEVAAKPLAGVDLMLDPSLSQSQMLKLRDLLTEHPGEVPVTLQMQLPDRTVRIATQETYKIDVAPALVSSLEGLLGEGNVRERYQASAVQ
jgi:hypothetical protein